MTTRKIINDSSLNIFCVLAIIRVALIPKIWVYLCKLPHFSVIFCQFWPILRLISSEPARNEVGRRRLRSDELRILERSGNRVLTSLVRTLDLLSLLQKHAHLEWPEMGLPISRGSRFAPLITKTCTSRMTKNGSTTLLLLSNKQGVRICSPLYKNMHI